jgi:hypothetical protein
MGIEIDEHIREATYKCNKDFACLQDKKTCLCEVDHVNGNRTVQIQTKPVNSCQYILKMGSSVYCLCPVRNEIYNRYKI